ncbi:MAG: hypothetical protein KTR30_37870, partial [Saprospiraceae bacterium]|nr:hypothetical protein [Saprospiraceae bacterium]
MRFISVFFVFTIFLLSPFETEGQSLFKDSKTLVQRVDDIRQTNLQRSLVMNTLQQIRRDSSLFDSLQTLIRLDTLRKDSILLTRAMVSHSSQILAILDHYRDWADEESEFLERIEKLNEVFGSDKDLGGILRTVKLDSLLNTHLELLRESFYNYQDTLRSARQREKILRLLHAEESVSPLEYIS